MRKYFNFVLIVLFLIIINSIFISAKDYEINSYQIDYTLEKDGLVSVNEKINYSLNGCFKELYITKDPSLEILSPNGYCENEACNFRVDLPDKSISGNKELILSGDFCDKTITANFNYKLKKVIRQLTNGTQFFYKIYGKETEKKTNVEITINVPGDISNTNYYLHIDKDILEIKTSDYNLEKDTNKIIISKFVNSNQEIEINLLMPSSWFNTNNSNYYIYPSKIPSKEEVINIENEWIQKQDQQNERNKVLKILLIIGIILAIISPFIVPLLIWLIFGKEYSKAETGYFGIYERDLPSSHDPLQANYLINGNFSKHWFSSAIMQLVWKRKLEIIKENNKYFLLKGKDISSVDKLPSYVEKIYPFILKQLK
ncbi:MAG: DUF2207 domain-containing protein, partial [archaeon]